MIDKDFQHDLHTKTREYKRLTRDSDTIKWDLAKMVNDWWGEHQSIFQGVLHRVFTGCQ